MKATYLEILVTGIATFALSLLVHKLYIRWANLHGIGAIGGGRHVHSGFVPVVGGMSFFTTFILVFLPVYFFYGHLNDFSLPGIFAGMIIVHALGVADDIKGISPGLKFAGSALAAALYVMTNRIAIEIYFPLIGIVDLGVFAPLFNIVWIMGIINATNLLDGIDGLAGGIFVIATLVITFFAWQSGDLDALFLMAIMMASVVGFLRYNYHPARVFMGDGGSLLLGFLLGVMPLRVLTFDNGFVNYTILLSILLLPFLDTATAFIRRMLQGRHPFYPDKEHLHHRLLTLGARVPQATLILWFFFGPLRGRCHYDCQARCLSGGCLVYWRNHFCLFGTLAARVFRKPQTPDVCRAQSQRHRGLSPGPDHYQPNTALPAGGNCGCVYDPAGRNCFPAD
jgi:UDP-GlcNAc:undecaprenyl-phosphate GlcNAc-1-phosphate transferase